MINYDIEYIKRLLDSFYDGDTSLEEEEILKQYFSRNDVPEQLEAEQKIFLDLFSGRGGCQASSLEQKLDLLIDNFHAEEERSIISLPRKSKKIILWKKITAVAACILVLISAGLFLLDNHSGKMNDTYSDPQDAYIETQKALTFVSSKLNKGFEQMESAQKNLEKTNKIIAKNLQL